MSKPTPLKEALKEWEKKEEGRVKEEAEEVLLYGWLPSIAKMDASLSTLKKCKKLSLSTNQIDKITSISGMDNLQILSVGRNNIKKVEGLDGVVDTLEQLWISYNLVEKLAGVEKLKNLTTLYMSNNKVSDWKEFDRLSQLPKLEDLNFVNNPLYNDVVEGGGGGEEGIAAYRIEILKKLPQLKKIDGQLVSLQEKEAAGLA